MTIRSIKRELKFIYQAFLVKNEYSRYLNRFTYYKILRTKRRTQSVSKIFGVNIEYPDSFWLLYSIRELFIEEVYKFIPAGGNPTIIDCGSNIGLSIYYFKRNNPAARIIAFEPDPILYKQSVDNIKALKIDDNVELINRAVWITDGEISFFAEGTLGGAIIEETQISKEVIKLPCVNLNNYLDGKIDFLKVDIEGAELQVLENCQEKLKNVAYMFVEYHGFINKEQRLAELLNIISDAGFRYYIKESFENLVHPFVEKIPKKTNYDILLNIFCYRIDPVKH